MSWGNISRVTKVIGLAVCNPINRIDCEQAYLIEIKWNVVPWYARFLGIVRLPYDVVRFIVTGRLMVIPWPWRW